MGLLDRWARRRGYVPAAESDARAMQIATEAVRRARRIGAMARVPGNAAKAFAAARQDTTVESWVTGNTTLNQDLYRDLRRVRERSRDLAQNQDYATAFLRRVKDNVVGHAGIALQAKPLRPDGKIDKGDALTIENAWYNWGRKGNCEVTGRLSWRDLQNVVIELVARDGECLVRRVSGKRFGPFGYQLQLLDAALLDEDYNADLANGNKVRMSVEFDAWRRPVAYHLRGDSALDLTGYSYAGKRERVPASDLLHLFVPIDADQIRGVPWMHTGILRLHQLGEFEYSAVTAARAGAAKMGFFTSDIDDDVEDVQARIAQRAAAASAGSGTAEAEAPHQYYQEATPNHFDVLPRGVDFKEYTPEYPHQHYGEFVKSCLRGVASGVGVNYNAFAQDWESVNFHSGRVALAEERDVWRGLQAWLVEGLHDIVFPEWLGSAMLTAALTLPVSKFDKFNAAYWKPRTWPSIKPLEDAQTAEKELALGITSRTRWMIERGLDPEEIWAELEQESKRLKGILPTPTPAAAGVAVSGGNENADDDSSAQQTADA